MPFYAMCFVADCFIGRRDSLSEDDPQMQNMLLSSMQNSMWGDVMSEAMQEEESKYEHGKDKDKR